MLSVRERLAALRAKRQGPSDTNSVKDGEEGNLMATLEKHAHCSAPVQSISPLQEKTLSPVRMRRHGRNARVNRLLWRQEELKRARNIAARNVMNSDSYAFMTMPVPEEEKLTSSPPAENLAQNEGNNNVDRGVQDEDEDEDEDGDEDGDDGGDDDGDFADQDEEERALQTAKQQECHDEGSEIDDKCDLSTAEVGFENLAPESLPQRRESANINSCFEIESHSLREEALPRTTSSAMTATQHSPNPGSTPVHVSRSSSEVLENKSEEIDSEVKEETIELYAKSNDFFNIQTLVDEEAEEDEIGGKNLGPSKDRGSLSDAETSEQEDESDGIVADCEENHNVTEIASFHHQWEMDKERAQIEAAVCDTQRLLDFGEEAVDLANVVNENAVTSGSSHSRGPNAVDDSGCNQHSNCPDARDEKSCLEQDAAAQYMEAMFRRDDSRSKVVDTDVIETKEDSEKVEMKRAQQRALWKARQRLKSKLSRTDDDSLGCLDLFGDGDSEKSRSEAIRKRLESACCPAEGVGANSNSNETDDKGKKRSTFEDAPEWLKQKACLERRQLKRQRSIAVSNWSFDPLGSRDKSMSKPAKSNSNSRLSLGASHVIRRNRTTVIQTSKSNIVIAKTKGVNLASASTRPPTSFKGLLNVLGKQAEKN